MFVVKTISALLATLVSSREDIDAAVKVARAVNGVTSVKNNMQLK